MNAFYPVFLFLSFLPFCLSAQGSCRTEIKNKNIKTLQVQVAGHSMSNPVIELYGPDRILISFDELSANSSQFVYTVTHCNADWTPSALSSLEYMSGFQNQLIDDYASSFNTTVSYTNYQLLVPNANVRLKVSGNYMVSVFNENSPNDTVLTACFSVVEPVVKIAGMVSSNTDIDFNNAHQQVSFSIIHPNYQIDFPQSDLKVFVLQDRRRDNMATNLNPMNITPGQITYQYNRALIFEAGNEYRRMEFLSNKFNDLHVKSIQYHPPYYHVQLMTDYVRSGKTYSFDQDQNGFFIINTTESDDPDTEADYDIVHFTLACDSITTGNVYLDGMLFHNILDSRSQMAYNPQLKIYEMSVLLKQGNYNYQYLVVPHGQTRGSTGPIEGNYYQTENEYFIMVYHRPMGVRYDKLIGVQAIFSSRQTF